MRALFAILALLGGLAAGAGPPVLAQVAPGQPPPQPGASPGGAPPLPRTFELPQAPEVLDFTDERYRAAHDHVAERLRGRLVDGRLMIESQNTPGECTKADFSPVGDGQRATFVDLVAQPTAEFDGDMMLGAGVLIRLSDDDPLAFLALLVREDGYEIVAFVDGWVTQRIGGNLPEESEWPVRAAARETEDGAEFFLNGVNIGSISDSGVSGSSLGLIHCGPGSYQFDNWGLSTQGDIGTTTEPAAAIADTPARSEGAGPPALPSAGAVWWVEHDGEARGPMTLEALRRRIEDGSSTPRTLVWREGMDDWAPAAEVLPAQQPQQPRPEVTFRTVMDDTGSVQVSVPIDWHDLNTAPASEAEPLIARLIASPNIHGYSTTYSTSGVEIVASAAWADEYEPGGILDEIDFSADCYRNPRQRITLPAQGYQGLVDGYANCGGDDHALVVFELAPQDGSFRAVMYVQAATPEELALLDPILESLLIIPQTSAPVVPGSQAPGITAPPPHYMVGIPTQEFEFFAAPHLSGRQRQTNWCWAATVQMVLNYHGLFVTQEQIVQRIFGGQIDAPASPTEILQALSGWAPDMRGRFSVVHAVPYSGLGSEIVSDLFHRWPLIVGLAGEEIGHAYVLTAAYYSVDPSTNEPIFHKVVLRDPWPDSPSRQEMDWHEFERRLTFISRVWVSRM